MCYIIKDAVKSCYASATDRDVEDIVKVWLKHAPQRFKTLQSKIGQ